MPTPPAHALVATDLDGTLLRRDDSVSPRTRAALALAAHAGARHLVVTGRPVPGVRRLLAVLGYGGPAVCGQGAQLYDAGAGRMVRTVTLDRGAADTALGKIEAQVGRVFAAVDQDGADGRTLIEPGYRMPHPNLPAQRVRRREELWSAPVIKVLIRHRELAEDALAEAARDAVGDLASVTHSGPGTVELQPYGVDKGTGLALAAEFLGTDAGAAIAFGDMPNDLPMFRAAGYGVAMAGAHPDLRAAADEVTSSNEDDGVAVVLERVFGRARTGRGARPQPPR